MLLNHFFVKIFLHFIVILMIIILHDIGIYSVLYLKHCLKIFLSYILIIILNFKHVCLLNYFEMQQLFLYILYYSICFKFSYIYIFVSVRSFVPVMELQQKVRKPT